MESNRAARNRKVVAERLGAKGYDEVCHARYDNRTCVMPLFYTLDHLESIAEKVITEEGEYDE